MKSIPRTRLAFAAVITTTTLLVAGCGDDTPASNAVDATPAPSEATPSETTPSESTPAAPEPVPLTDHVVDALPGFTADGVATLTDLKAFAREHEKTVQELKDSGMLEAASLSFQPSGGEGFAMSIAASYASPEQAEAEAARLFAANSEPDPGTVVTPLELAGIPGGQAIQMTGKEGGLAFTGTEVVFVDGAVMHEVFAFAQDPLLSVEDVLAAATAVYEAVAGHPVG
ncbi:hypothetical protein NSZ01_26310 [Nocardioides szechwanensis]|uniref:Lipoprotein n=1 Tax=Nocardioides szechwanensis TaxID=1005944 RepID=A0A1H0AGE2_9ACTN|nr:hypothetical protein [Nocardioides szechwanensis]GEP34863.1 hypothetical protein NSZ01_26310 [Nocardioides szechwanensis]SDN32630.1 hypothetical protein SAMN05192576_2031 [Nocardioides szechwanensis]